MRLSLIAICVHTQIKDMHRPAYEDTMIPLQTREISNKTLILFTPPVGEGCKPEANLRSVLAHKTLEAVSRLPEVGDSLRYVLLHDIVMSEALTDVCHQSR